MTNVPIGSQSNDGSRTPTLREYLKTGRALPQQCTVSTIFLPNKTTSYGLVSEGRFRVSINEGNDLFEAFKDNLEQWIDDNSFLCIIPDTSKPGAFEVVINADESTEWKSYEWGYVRVTESTKRRTRSKQKPTNVRPGSTAE